MLQCSASCGRGFKSRKVSCVTGSGRPITEENCQHLSPKPSRQRRCRGGRCPKWKTGSWGEVGPSYRAIKHSGSCSHAARPGSSFFSLSHSFHFNAYHLAGKCVHMCGTCEAQPAGIISTLLNCEVRELLHVTGFSRGLRQ